MTWASHAIAGVPMPAQIEVRSSTFDDRQAIYDILVRSGVFGRGDAECVDEMFVETWLSSREDNYRWLSCWCDGQMIGFACYGPESLTDRTWDLFWICVSPEARGKGAGRALIAEAEAQARRAGGRVMVIYTSSTPKYAPARRLYESAGFVRVAVVPDYYAEDDDLNIYWKRL
ncbi:MAG: GNAT family N-acetyltransferase [Anaerolineae bacterium]|nr:GNAT family N-acetyltransferase [Candidatus Roseilinea sp.]MDW8450326.1 GNAT family N-acetyltransferase [Anaerolineae bacterium]